MVYWITWQLGTSAYCDHETYPDHDDLSSFIVYNLMDLEDGWNEPMLLASRILMAIEDLKAKKRVVFMCAAGISRSNGLAIGVLSIYHNLSIDDGKRIVECICPRANPMPDLMDAIRQAVDLINGLF